MSRRPRILRRGGAKPGNGSEARDAGWRRSAWESEADSEGESEMARLPEVLGRVGGIGGKLFGSLGMLAGIVVLAVVAFGGWFIVPEGHQGVRLHFGEAVGQHGPGFHWKLPMIQDVEYIEVRTRNRKLELDAATRDRLQLRAGVSINWTAHKEAAKDIFVRYGSMEQFESRIVQPRIQTKAKEALSKFSADELIGEREKVTQEIKERLAISLEGFPLTLDSAQVENIDLPPVYMQAVLDKMKAYEDSQREKNVLEQQRLKALQEVNTAEADKRAAQERADGEAYRLNKVAEGQARAIILEGEARAKALAQIGQQLKNFPELVQYEGIQRWSGQVPQTVLGGADTNVLYGLNVAPRPAQ
jgi:regulator of protease activity HflC (stomatin/prohibitin superfamily)